MKPSPAQWRPRSVPISGMLTAATLVGAAGAQALAQCADWRARPILYRGGVVNALLSWDPDGPGPLPPVLVAAGIFDRAGGAGRPNVAAWDGTGWQALGTGMDDGVGALAVYNGDLIAGGNFLTAGGTPAAHIARWDGSAWQPLGSGISGNVGSFAPGVYALAVRNGELFAGGLFTTAGGVACSSIARWNGSSWQSVGSPLSPAPFVYALTVYNTDLIAGGAFDVIGGTPATNIARWNGTSWLPLAGGVGSGGGSGTSCDELGVHNGELIAAGDFVSPGANIAAWNGSSWRALGVGLPGFGYAVASFGGELYAGGSGSFEQWDGSQWAVVGPGTGGLIGDSVAALGVHNGQLYIGGTFNFAGGNIVDSVAHWNGSAWVDDIAGVTADPAGQVSAIAPWAGGVALGGTLDIHSRLDVTGIDTQCLGYWSGIGDAAAGPFPGGGAPSGPVNAFAVTAGPAFSSNLIVGGAFQLIFGVGANRIAGINDLQPGVTTFAPGFADGEVRAIVRHNSSIYAAGTFIQSGSTTVNRIAQWTGSSWVPLAGGMNGDVNALASFGGALYAGGAFTTAGGVSTGGLARWNGTSWSQVGGNFVGIVNALGSYQSNLVIGGLFPGINSSPNLAGFTGTAYFTYGLGGASAAVRAVTVSGNDLIIGGDFTAAGMVNAQHIARWNGSAWSQVGSGADGPVLSLARIGNEIHAGGLFNNVRAGAIHAPRWARFSEDGVPWAAVQPVPASVGCSQNASFQTAAATGYSVSYQWRRNGAPIASGPTGTGSTLVQATGPNLFIQNVSQADAGTYDCVLSNGCGNSTSQGATLTVNGTCPSGCYANCDGSTTPPVLNVLDFSCFLNAFAAADAYANCDASTTPPILNVLDFLCFLNRFAQGCS